MEVILVADAGAVAETAARHVRAQLQRLPGSCLGLATGSTPLPLYRRLGELCAAGAVTFARARAFLLDEYAGLDRGHPQAYRGFISRNLAEVTDLPEAAIEGPDGAAADLAAECARYEAAIAAAGGMDLLVLGIGRNGHIGFNEPGSSLGSRTRLKTLARGTVEANARFFASIESVPRHVVTMGIQTMMEARAVLLLATGGVKAEALRGAVEGPVTASCPASILQMHPRCVVVADEAAGSLLARAEDYRWVHANKPEWQRV
jgi:glucosamine-6-phosphate deaminase